MGKITTFNKTGIKKLPNNKALEEWRDVIPEYVKDYVSLNTFL
jgi:hypothetical protein